jgi:(2Fe-2S) ferredoxin
MGKDISPDQDKIGAKIDKLGIGKYERHVLFCAGEKCCDVKTGEVAWKLLKERLSEIGFNRLPIFRTKTTCLRICNSGPILVVYPEGVWYANVNAENLERIIEQHLLNDKVVEDLVIARNPLILDGVDH